MTFKKMLQKFILTSSLVLISVMAEASASIPVTEPLIRVAILEDVKDVTCSIKGFYQMIKDRKSTRLNSSH